MEGGPNGVLLLNAPELVVGVYINGPDNVRNPSRKGQEKHVLDCQWKEDFAEEHGVVGVCRS